MGASVWMKSSIAQRPFSPALAPIRLLRVRPCDHVLAVTPYCGLFASAIGRDRTVYGVQFHPEKSQKPGFQMLKNFIAL